MFYKKMLKIGLSLVCFVFLVSCSGEDKTVYDEGVKLQKVSFASLNEWNKDNLGDGFDKAIKDVCLQINNKNDEFLGEGDIRIPLKEYKIHCENILKIKDHNKLKEYIYNNFEPYKVIYNNCDEGKFTSYYEADVRVSYKKDEKYKYPIYGKPVDLIEINLQELDSSLPNKRLVGRVENGKIVKYYTRKEIEEKNINAPVILWGDDLVDIHIMQIQGAAVGELPDGSKIRIGYADNNGHKFRGIGSILLEKKVLESGKYSMDNIREWLRENKDLAKENMQLNDRFIFHKIVEADGPIGAMGLPLVAGRSMAVDRDFIPLGAMIWLETVAPNAAKINKLVMAQDIGGAIKGAIRGDYFWGSGEEAFINAGKMNSKGKYYLMLPKNIEVKINE